MMNLNYRRGLQRVYIVLSVVWMATVLVVAVRDRPVPDILVQPRTPEAHPLTLPPDFFDKVATQPVTDANRFSYWSSRIAFVVLPPAFGYLILFLVAPWVVRGFRNE